MGDRTRRGAFWGGARGKVDEKGVSVVRRASAAAQTAQPRALHVPHNRSSPSVLGHFRLFGYAARPFLCLEKSSSPQKGSKSSKPRSIISRPSVAARSPSGSRLPANS